ncbi:Peptide chain release factor 1 [hydrothermal vent metagenome]|uniref:Peptide chain release factor 1 n=1 Tax=hydrothermal vent metagenome TaxID=652676 RepID=A0A3B0S8V7_9ZZZZ
MSIISQQRLSQVIDRFEEIEARMGAITDPVEIVALSKEHASIKPVADSAMALLATHKELAELETLQKDVDSDAEMRELAEMERQELLATLPDQEHQMQLLLLPKDKDDEAPVMIEVRAGTGGDEAALFAGDLFRMYQRFCQLEGFQLSLLSSTLGDHGGFKEVIANVKGAGVFGRLKFESGVHRVQRVPDTETQGRIHTSAATVAVLPEPEDIDIQIADKDLRIDVFRASGPGGQSVNTTDSAVRITHLPTGIVASQQDEKSQHKNRAKAMLVLKARLYEKKRSEADALRSAERKDQVGSGDRSEKVRTYNYPQGRVTDHRIKLTIQNLPKIISGDGLAEVIDALITEDQARKLAALEDV